MRFMYFIQEKTCEPTHIWKTHKWKKRAQEEKKLDKAIAESDASVTVFTMDMMAVKLCAIFKVSAL